MRVKDIVPLKLSKCAEFIEGVYKANKNTAYRVLFNTHITTFYDPDKLSGSWPSDYKNLMYTTVIPVSVTNKRTGGRLRVAIFDENDAVDKRVKGLLDYLNAEYLFCDLENLDRFQNYYRELITRNHKSNVDRKKVINRSESALLREIQVGLGIRESSESSDIKKTIQEEYPKLAAVYEARKDGITIHAEYALSKLFDIEAEYHSLSNDERNIYEKSRVDLMVSMRTSRSQPKYGGEILFGAEFDGGTHSDKKRIKNDEIKNNYFMQAGIPLLRVGIRSDDSTSLKPVTNNDTVIANPEDIHIFLREIINEIFEYRMNQSLINKKYDWLFIDSLFADALLSGKTSIERVTSIVNEEIQDSCQISVYSSQKLAKRRISLINRIVKLGGTNSEQSKEIIMDEEASIHAEQHTYLQDIPHLIEHFSTTQTEKKILDRWYEVEEPIVNRDMNNCMSGIIRYRTRSSHKKTYEEEKVGPFDVRVITSSKDEGLFNSVLDASIKSMLRKKLIERSL